MISTLLSAGIVGAALALLYHNRTLPSLNSALYVLGTLYFINIALVVAKIIRFFAHPSCSWRAFRGQWALITAASAGIGLELADKLAACGVNIIICSRRAEVLKEITDRLEKTYGIKAVGFVADLTVPGSIEAIASRFPAPPSIVIANGGGLASGGFKAFTEWRSEEVRAAQQLTSGHVYELVRLFLPGMLAKRSGRILLVGSFSARFPQYIIPYAADKARLRAFALGLHEELRGSGVEVQYQALGAVLTPGYQKTAGSHAVPEPTFLVPSAASVADAMLRKFGSDAVITPHWAHALQEGMLFGLLPEWVATYAIRSAIEPFLRKA